MPVKVEDVVAAYRLILGRYPESDAVVMGHTSARNIHQLREAFLNSEEFTQGYRRRQKADVRDLTLYLPVVLPPMAAEVSCSPAELALLLKRVADTWKDLGQNQPHWSVLMDHKFMPDAFEENAGEFYRTGADDLKIIQSVLARCEPSFSLETAEVTEFGCGVGRVTAPLAKACRAVFACDVSEPHLNLARVRVAEAGIGNVSFHVVTERELSPAPECDLWFSRIVLQHNPPPVIASILQHAFTKIRPGGIAIFQVPTYQAGYSFDISKYLAAKPSGHAEMHAIPQKEVFRIASAFGLQPLEVREDNSVGSPYVFTSNLFCFLKPKK